MMPDQPIQEALFSLVDSLKRNMNEALDKKNINIPPMHINAMFIIRNHERCTAANIVNTVSRDKAQITRLLNDLEQQELIKRIPNPNDNRSQLIQLTRSGKAALRRIRATEAPIICKMTKDLTDRDIERFVTLATKMKGNLD